MLIGNAIRFPPGSGSGVFVFDLGRVGWAGLERRENAETAKQSRRDADISILNRFTHRID